MANRDPAPFALELPSHVQQAPEIACEQQIGVGRCHIGRLLFDHSVGDVRILHSECASEPATNLGISHFGEFKTSYGGEEPPWLALDPELAETRAAVVIGDTALEVGIDALHAA